MSTETEAIVPGVKLASLLPVFGGRDMAHAFTAYRELQHALDTAMPDQLMDIKGRMFRKKGYWRAIATAFNLSVECVKEESDDFGWRAIYRATALSGRHAEGDGACSNEEKGEGQDTEHNVRSHAHTRAFNRSVSNLVGFGEVSAEEANDGGRARPTVVPTDVVVPTGEAPTGFQFIHKAWKDKGGWYHILLPDANGGFTRELKTKKEQVGELALQAFQLATPVRVDGSHSRTGEAEWLNGVQTPKPDVDLGAIDREIAVKEGLLEETVL